MFTRVSASPRSITTASSHVAHVQRSLPSSARSAVMINSSALASVWRLPACDNSLLTLVDAALTTKTTKFARFSPVSADWDCPTRDFPRSSDVDGERSPALDPHALPVDDLTVVDHPAAALNAYLDRDAPSDAAWGDDPGELGDVRARSRRPAPTELGAALTSPTPFSQGANG